VVFYGERELKREPSKPSDDLSGRSEPIKMKARVAEGGGKTAE